MHPWMLFDRALGSRFGGITTRTDLLLHGFPIDGLQPNRSVGLQVHERQQRLTA